MDYFTNENGRRFTHGTANAYVNGKCRCDLCRTAHSKRAAQRRREQLYGRWENPFVDAQPVREHVLGLMKAGWGLKQIAAQADVAYSPLSYLIYGRPESVQNDAPYKKPKRVTKILRETAQKVLALHYAVEKSSPGTLVSARGTHRPIQALMRIGYSQAFIAKEAGWTAPNFSQIMRRDMVTADTHRQIAELYAKYENTPRSADGGYIAASISRAMSHAVRNRYVPPAGWDDIDNDAKPAQVDREPVIDEVKFDLLLSGTPIELNKVERRALIPQLVKQGISRTCIAELTGLDPKTISRISQEAA